MKTDTNSIRVWGSPAAAFAAPAPARQAAAQGLLRRSVGRDYVAGAISSGADQRLAEVRTLLSPQFYGRP